MYDGGTCWSGGDVRGFQSYGQDARKREREREREEEGERERVVVVVVVVVEMATQ